MHQGRLALLGYNTTDPGAGNGPPPPPLSLSLSWSRHRHLLVLVFLPGASSSHREPRQSSTDTNVRCQCLQLLLTSGFLLGKPAAQVISSQLLSQEATRRRRLSISVKFRLLSRPSLEHREIFFQITALLQMPGTGMVEADSYPTWFEEVVECEKADQLPASETFSSSRPPAQPLSPGHGQEPAGCWDGDSLSQRKTPAHYPMAAKEVFWRKLYCLDTSFSGVFQLPKKRHRKSLVSILHLYKREYEIIILRARGI